MLDGRVNRLVTQRLLRLAQVSLGQGGADKASEVVWLDSGELYPASIILDNLPCANGVNVPGLRITVAPASKAGEDPARRHRAGV